MGLVAMTRPDNVDSLLIGCARCCCKSVLEVHSNAAALQSFHCKHSDLLLLLLEIAVVVAVAAEPRIHLQQSPANGYFLDFKNEFENSLKLISSL